MDRNADFAAASEAASTEDLKLPAELTIYTVGELHPQWLAWLHAVPADGPASTVQAQAVEQVDAAGLQLLLALSAAMTARGCALRLHEPSEALRQGCDALGLSPWLQTQSASPSGVAA